MHVRHNLEKPKPTCKTKSQSLLNVLVHVAEAQCNVLTGVTVTCEHTSVKSEHDNYYSIILKTYTLQ